MKRDLIGKRFGRLTVLNDSGERRYRNILWECRCDCGKIKNIQGTSLTQGKTMSCGCLQSEIARDKENEKNPMWKGDDVSLLSLHGWVRRRKQKPKKCEACGEREPQDLANISQEYKRDISDYRWLCRKCHMESDKRMTTRRSNGQFSSIHTS